MSRTHLKLSAKRSENWENFRVLTFSLSYKQILPMKDWKSVEHCRFDENQPASRQIVKMLNEDTNFSSVEFYSSSNMVRKIKV